MMYVCNFPVAILLTLLEDVYIQKMTNEFIKSFNDNLKNYLAPFMIRKVCMSIRIREMNIYFSYFKSARVAESSNEEARSHAKVLPSSLVWSSTVISIVSVPMQQGAPPP